MALQQEALALVKQAVGDERAQGEAMERNGRQRSMRRSEVHLLALLALVLVCACSGSLATVARAAVCSNETIRVVETYGSRLPDCRAYEQVSPVDKGFYDALGEVGLVQSSPSGEGVTFFSLGPFPGVAGSAEAVTYLSMRGDGEEQWRTEGLLPATGPEVGARLAGFSEDLSQAVVETENTPVLDPDAPAGELASYLRDSATGSYRPLAIGAGVTFAAATPDGSQVLFETEKDLLPGEAAPGVVNLYDWDEGRLSVAGVLPDGSAPAAGSVAGSGGAKDEYDTQTTNTISADGSRVFFSDTGTGQLYARENPGGPSARTVQVSASEKTNGGGPGGADSDGPQPASFMAATPSGSQVFFTSHEELTNDANTGPAPGVGRANLDGSSSQPSFIPASAKGIAVNSEYVYWANPNENSIGRARLDGTEIDQSFITGASNPQYVAVYGEYLYWTNAAKEEQKEGSIGRAKMGAGGAEAVERQFITKASDPQGIAVNSEYIYWANIPERFNKGTIARAKIDGEDVELKGFVTNTAAPPGGIALDSEYIYWAIPSAGEIGRAPIAGGKGAPAFITGASDPQGIAVNSAYVYWADAGAGTIARASLAGGTGEAPLVAGLTGPSGVAVDGAHLYWASGGGDEGDDLYRYELVPGSGPALTDLTPDPGDPDGAEVLGVLGVSQDGSYVYFVANGVLAAGASAGDCDSQNDEVREGECNLYVWHAGLMAFIARLNGSSDVKPDVQQRRDRGESEGPDAGFKSSRVDPAGTALLFTSHEKLVGYENAGYDELYLYRAASEAGPATLRCVSCNPDHVAADAEAYLGHDGLEVAGPSSRNTVYLPRNLSENGGRAFFQTTETLQTEGESGTQPSTNGQMNVYEWEEAGEGSCPAGQGEGCVYLLSTGQSTNESFFGDASANGDDVFFFTRQPLVAQDDDENIDLYDARVDGGIPPQNPSPPTPPCEDEGACHAASPGAPPVFGAPSSSTWSGAGTFTPALPAKQQVKGVKTSKPLTRTQQLARALESCDKQHPRSNRKRRACEAYARKHYRPKPAKRVKKAKTRDTRRVR
jgi:virginiamycin B lyase